MTYNLAACYNMLAIFVLHLASLTEMFDVACPSHSCSASRNDLTVVLLWSIAGLKCQMQVEEVDGYDVRLGHRKGASSIPQKVA